MTRPRLTRRRALARGLTTLGSLSLGLLVAQSASRIGLAQPDEPATIPAGPPPSTTPVADGPRPDGTASPAAPASTAGTPAAATDGPSVAGTPAADAPGTPDAPDAGPPVAEGPWGTPPVKLMIPSLGVEGAVVGVGVDEDGSMTAPKDPDTVAWYEPGPGMGVPGNVVFAAHVDWGGRLRVFGRLAALDPGDIVQVIDADGHGYEYAVQSSRWVRAEGAPVEEIFAQTESPTITMITCGGEFVPSRREYLDRLIVRARGA
jgi:hypothetical protein